MAHQDLAGLSNTLQTYFEDWLQKRKPQEDKWLRNYEDNLRISREDDTKETGVSRAQKSRVFVGSTRGKIRSARAKIKDVLFGAGKMPFDTEPTNEKLKEFSDTFEEILTYQLTEGKAKKAVSVGVGTICIFGTGYICGPFPEEKKHKIVQSNMADGAPQLAETEIAYDCPMWESARTLDVYPDPEAESEQEGRGVFWAARKDHQYLRSLKGRPGYSDAAIDMAINGRATEGQLEGSEIAEQRRANIYRFTADGRVWLNRFFGIVKRSELEDWQRQFNTAAEPAPADDAGTEAHAVEAPPSTDPDEYIEAIVIMAGGYVIKADENTYKKKQRPIRRCVYEEVENEIYGVGIADNNEPHQKVTNAAFRLFLEGKAYSLIPLFSIDASKFLPTEDFKVFPGKKFQFRPGLTPEERKEAIIMHVLPDVTAGWEKVIELSSEFSDDDTGITKYSQGTDSDTLNKTATGISMIMNASSLPIKEVIGNIDEMWIEHMVEDLIDWDLEHLEPETVAVLLGEKQAANWMAIKKFGKTSFMDWNATGSQTFMMKEVLMQKLQGFLQIVAANPTLANLVDMRELLEQVWSAGEVGKESPVYDEETLKKMQSEGPQAEIQKVTQEAQKAIEQLQRELADAKGGKEVELAKIRADEQKSLWANFLKMLEVGPKIDLTQAQTVTELAKGGFAPDGSLLTAATTQEQVNGPEGIAPAGGAADERVEEPGASADGAVAAPEPAPAVEEV